MAGSIDEGLAGGLCAPETTGAHAPSDFDERSTARVDPMPFMTSAQAATVNRVGP